jgi:hypothetical protein
VKEADDEERYEDVEFWIKPKGEVFQPKYEDWSGFCSIRDPNYRERMGHKFWLSENRRMDEFCANWFRDREIPGSEDFWKELDDLSWAVIRKWQAEEIHKWSIEDDDPEEINTEGLATVIKENRKWPEEYWRNHPECHQISEERFRDETTRRWDQESGIRVFHIVKEYQIPDGRIRRNGQNQKNEKRRNILGGSTKEERIQSLEYDDHEEEGQGNQSELPGGRRNHECSYESMGAHPLYEARSGW